MEKLLAMASVIPEEQRASMLAILEAFVAVPRDATGSRRAKRGPGLERPESAPNRVRKR